MMRHLPDGLLGRVERKKLNLTLANKWKRKLWGKNTNTGRRKIRNQPYRPINLKFEELWSKQNRDSEQIGAGGAQQ